MSYKRKSRRYRQKKIVEKPLKEIGDGVIIEDCIKNHLKKHLKKIL